MVSNFRPATQCHGHIMINKNNIKYNPDPSPRYFASCPQSIQVYIHRARSSILCLRGSCIEEICTICTFQNKGVDAVKLMPFMGFRCKRNYKPSATFLPPNSQDFRLYKWQYSSIKTNWSYIKLLFTPLKYIVTQMLQYSCAFKINPSSFIPMPIDVANHFILNPFSYFLI